jgi:eukaryotic-like serine/threonine-protein kinase
MPDPIGGVQPFAELARNGPTVVYKGYQQAHGRVVLLKAVRSELAAEAGFAERLAEEARLAARVRHPNVVAVLESGTDGATGYLVTEFVEGLDLRALVARGPLPPELAAYVVREAARGLAAVHAAGILHRDLKPANVLVSASGEVKLADFGLASLAPEAATAEVAEVRGTYAYLAPEVVRGAAPGPRADLFALGAVLVELLTGRAAFLRGDPGATLDAVLHHDPLPALAADPRVPPELAALAAALLAKDPAGRVGSAAELGERLEASAAGFGRDGAEPLARYLLDPDGYVAPLAPGAGEEPAPVRPTPARPAAGSSRRWAAAAAALFLAALAVGYVRLGPEPEPPIPAEPAEERATPEQGTAVDRGPGPDGPADIAEEPTAEATPDEAEPDEAEPDEAAETAPPLDQTAEGTPAEGAPAATGALEVVAEPWARVSVDGAPVGTTPLGALAVPVGVRAVTFENPDFPPLTVEVVVAREGTARVAVSLWDLVGRVALEVSPWARVSVDGTYWDTVPPQERPLILRPGTHRLTFEHPTLGTRELPLYVAAGEVRVVRVNLAEGQRP